MSELAHRNKVIADLNIKTAEKAVKIKAITKHLECYIYSWEWARYSHNVDCTILYFTAVEITNMDLIRDLQEHQAKRRGAQRILRLYGINDINAVEKPFVEMDKVTVTRVLLNWLAFNSKDGQDYEVRLQIPEQQTIYRTQIAKRQGTLYIRKTKEAPEQIGKALHCWLNDVKYHTLTHDEVQRSVKRADAVNNLTEDVLQAALLWKHGAQDKNE